MGPRPLAVGQVGYFRHCRAVLVLPAYGRKTRPRHSGVVVYLRREVYMNIGEILPGYYRYNLEANLPERVEVPPTRQDFLLIDSVMGVKPPPSALKAPQDVGEYKHSTVDENPQAGPEPENSGVVRVIEQVFKGSTAGQTQQYRAFSRLNLLESRKNMENIVRKIKRLGRQCPFCSDSQQCTKVFIRCGQRLQFSQRETIAQQGLAHACNYFPSVRDGSVLIVEGDAHVREFCKQSLALFLGRDDATITTTDSAAMAIEELNRSKINKSRFGLVIVDAGLPGNSGYWLINELFQRNYDADIIITKDKSVRSKPPKDYIGDIEIAPQERFVSGVLTKPFHSDALIDALKKLRFR